VAALAIGPIACVAGQTAFRRLYYGDWVPNTYHVKVAFTVERLAAGWEYVSRAGWPNAALIAAVLLSVAAAGFEPRLRRRVFYGVTFAGVWVAYVVVVGGDIMAAHRHLVVAVVIAAITALDGARWLVRGSLRRQAAGVAVVVALLAGYTYGQLTDPQRRRHQGDRWYWAGRPIGMMLRRAFAETQPLLASDAAGCLPYYYRGPALDMLGLCDRYLATHRPASFGRGYIGHELGNGAYTLSRKPDLIAFGSPSGQEQPRWAGGRQLVRMHEFAANYRLVHFRSGPPDRATVVYWARAEDGRIGVQRRPGVVQVPGFLLSAGARSVATLDLEGRLGTVVAPGANARIDHLLLPAGTWRLSVDATGGVAVEVDGPGAGLCGSCGPNDNADLVLPDHPVRRAVTVTLGIPAGAPPVRVFGLRFEAVAPRRGESAVLQR